jgi:hypothetical protein
MKFDIPKIVKVLNAGDYAAELEPVKIQVWVNPPRSLLVRHDEMIAKLAAAMSKRLELGAGNEVDAGELAKEIEAVRGEMTAVFSELWSAGTDPERRWSAAEIDKLITGMFETDPQLWPWLRNRTIEMIREHRENVKKG